MVISVLYLGRLDYPTALQLQERLVLLRKEGQIPNTLLLLEHPPVLTLGRNSRRENILLAEGELARRGATLVETNRGGDVTYHGPGQLVGYPIFDLRAFTPRLGAVDFVRGIEEVLIRLCAEFNLLTTRIPGRTGVWTVPGGSVPERKIAAIGIHISAGITSHGFALNVTTDLRDFSWIVPCGIADRGVTSLELEVSPMRTGASQTFPLQEIAERVSRQFGHVFHAQMLWLESLDELLPRRSSMPALA
jgi:lipoyl(octanoyl) transferase